MSNNYADMEFSAEDAEFLDRDLIESPKFPDKEQIIVLGVKELLDEKYIRAVVAAKDPELETAFMLRAAEFHLKTRVAEILKAYKQLEKEQQKRQKLIEKEQKNAEQAYRKGFTLETSDDGKVRDSINNFFMIITHDKKFSGLKYNTLTYSPEQERDGKIYKWTDSDDADMRWYIEKEYHIHNIKKSDDALRKVFAENEYHPIRNIVDKIQWDGKDRISSFLTDIMNCDDSEYVKEVSRLIFAGGIHRLYEPGCKFDDMPVLIGTNQGEGKSTIVRWLAMDDSYFSEVREFDGQKGIEAIEGAWICEISELLALTKSKEVEAVKSYITCLNDKYRKPYDKYVTDHPRQCIFIGTTNKQQFLTDKTGNRRFYPVIVHSSAYELYDRESEVKEYIRQCWGEAKAKYDNEFMMPYARRDILPLAVEHQSEAVEDDYRVGMIENYLEDKSKVCIIELWQQALKNENSNPSRKDSNDIALILQKNFPNWKRSTNLRFPGYGPQKAWVREENDIILIP